jgi:hypothetical protein
MRRLFLILLVVAVAGCHEKPQPVDTTTGGNATDRTTNGTNGTGEPASPANDTAAAAGQLDTAGTPTTTSGSMPVTATEVVHGQQTVTTSTAQGPAGTGTAAVATPTQTTETILTTTGTTTAVQTKKKH